MLGRSAIQQKAVFDSGPKSVQLKPPIKCAAMRPQCCSRFTGYGRIVQGTRTGGYARTTPQKQATMQHEYYFKIVKECDDQFCKKEENKAINSKNNITNEHLHLRISLENFQRSQIDDSVDIKVTYSWVQQMTNLSNTFLV